MTVMDLIYALRMIAEKAREFDTSVFVTFIDLLKAFYSISRKKLWRCLEEEHGIKGKLKRAITL